MGFFYKSNAQRKVTGQPNGGRVSGGSPSDLGNVLGTEEIRANLANLFTEDGDADDPTVTAFSDPQRPCQPQRSVEPRSSGPLAREKSRLKSPRSSRALSSFQTCSRSPPPKIDTDSAIETSVRPLTSISTLENVGSPVEEITPLSEMAPNVFPDAGKSKSPNALSGGPSDSAKWPLQSPCKNRALSPRQRSLMGTSPASQSPSGRKHLISRSNSIQRIARRASSLKRKPSMKHSSDASPDQEATLLKPPRTPTQRDSDVFSELQQVPAAYSDSPTTPCDIVQEDPARQNAAKPLVPIYSLMDDLASQSFDLPVPVAGISKKYSADDRSVCEAATTLPLDSESGLRRNGDEVPKDPNDESADAAIREAGPTLNAIASSEMQFDGEDTSSSSALNTENWGCIDADDFTETYGFDIATARDFPSIPLSNENGDGGLGQPQACDVDFSPHGGSDGESDNLFAPSKPAYSDAAASAEDESQKTEYICAMPKKQKSKGKARKRPPPLLTPEPASASSTPSSTSSSTVFASNGDFTTGGFRITAEGMVGKPDRVTRRDSDDAPSMACIPATTQDILIARGLQEFRKGPTLGMGAAGRVYLAIHEPSGKSMAIKVVNVYDAAKRNQLLKELDTLSSHVSRFLVRFYGAFYDGKGAVHIALEFMDGGCLDSTVAKFGAIPEPVTKMIAADCLRALRFLHRHNVLHRDFKTANILLSKKSLCAKVSDFGLARDMDAGVSRVDTFVGTIAYMSPERLHGGKYTYASDIWALGISIVECILGRYPFDKPQSYFDYLDVQANDMLKGVRGASRDLKDFVQLCTDADPRRRPTAAQLMQHPWLANMKRDPEMFRLWMDTLVSPKSDTASTKSVQSIRGFLADGNFR